MVDLINSMKISATGLAAHRTKMNVIAGNLANVDTTRTAEGGPYIRRMVVLKGKDLDKFKTALQKNAHEDKKPFIEMHPIKFGSKIKDYKSTGVEVAKIIKSQEDFRLVYNPAHPDADPVSGYVAMPNVDHLTEVADMIVAKRAYEASITAVSNTKSMILKALELGK